MTKKVCTVRETDLTDAPLVYLNGMLLQEGSDWNDMPDYCWKVGYEQYSVISFEFRLKSKDVITLLFRDDVLNPIECVRLFVEVPIAPNVPFNIRTGLVEDE